MESASVARPSAEPDGPPDTTKNPLGVGPLAEAIKASGLLNLKTAGKSRQNCPQIAESTVRYGI